MEMQEKAQAVDGERNLRRLRESVAYVKRNSAFYRSFFASIDKNQLRTIKDFRSLPYVSKKDLAGQPKDFWCVKPDEIIDYCSTSGSEGHPLSIPLTDLDMDRLATNEAGSFAMAGITHKDIIQLCTTADRRFMAGLAYLLGARKLGAGVVRSGPGLAEYQWNTMFETQASVLIIVPSFLVKLLHYSTENGIDPSKTAVRKVICIGESIRNPDFSLNALGMRITEKWNIDLHSTYASSEMQTAFTECRCMNGGHYNPELIFPEIIDENEQSVKPGEVGELVVTTLGVKGLPLVRFKTGDITSIHLESCKCGNPSPRIGCIRGRKNQMIKIKGTTCYPPAIIEVLNTLSEVENFQIHILHNDFGNDEIHIYFHSEVDVAIARLSDYFRARLRFTPDFYRVSASEIRDMVYPKDSRKAILFRDLRVG